MLALTATPGADVQRVQSVVDALHISRIEIREAEAPEIRKYMNEKVCLLLISQYMTSDTDCLAYGEALCGDGLRHRRLPGPMGFHNEGKHELSQLPNCELLKCLALCRETG